MSDSTLVAPGFLRRGPAAHEEPEPRRRFFSRREQSQDANTASPRRLEPSHAAELDRLERLVVPPRAPAIPPTPDPLSPEVAALVPQAMVEKAKAFRDATLASYQDRIDNTNAKFAKAQESDLNAYHFADRMTAALVESANKMAVETARYVANVNQMETDLRAASDASVESLRAVAEKHVPHAVAPDKIVHAEWGRTVEREDLLGGELHEAAEAIAPEPEAR